MNKVVKRIIGTMSIGVMTLGISLGANAQSIKNEKEVKGEKESIMVRANQVWSYHGTSSDSPTDPSKYSLGPSEECEGAKQTICQINAPANPSNPSQPDMTALVTPSGSSTPTTIALRISAANSSKTPNETVTDFRPF
ncbi:hypothetical protein [Sphingobacterium athyrii]|uniref:Uncharacterized protein n=1 Tax=Sphingobacterium athyrii TaxID=2152717 RepID=A0A363NQ47_9SPHI|nr:hypothetical protein [Sphingobacterium athyrii]PUV22894.1 hypothetical protein DCO56_18395 [Sphingobacterium athyrii]